MDTLNKDLYSLSKYQEWYALKHELAKFIDDMGSIDDINLDKETSSYSRLTIAEEVAGKKYAQKQVRMFLNKMGLWEKDQTIKKKDPYL